MEHILHKLPEGFIITSDEEIKIGEKLCTIFDDGLQYIDICTQVDKQEHLINYNGKLIKWTSGKHCFKLIAQQDQIIFSALSEEEQKEIEYFNLNKFKIRQWNNHKPINNDISTENGFKDGLEIGFKKAQELLSDRKFTLEDIRLAFNNGYSQFNVRNMDCKDYIESLSQPKSWKVELEMDIWHDRNLTSLSTLKPKLTNGKVKIIKLL